MRLLARLAEGLALLVVLGGQYLASVWLGRLWPAAGRAWQHGLHGLGGPWFASFCRRHGALLIKTGQFVASRPDVFPLAYVDACVDLRDQAPARDFHLIRRQLETAYEGRVADHLPRIDEEPIAAASFGQVHRAWLKDGTLVAIKVQYPDLGLLVACDLWLLGLTTRLFHLALPGWPLHLIYNEIRRSSHEEQDYLHEGLAADRLRQPMIAAGLKVPRVLWEHTREKVLVMEFAQGATLARTDIGAITLDERRRLALMIIDAYLAQLLEVGFFHGDPHAGNFIYDGRDLWLIDFGMTAEVGQRERMLYRRFLGCLRREDTDGMVEVVCDLGVQLPGSEREHLRALAREIYSEFGHLNPRAFKGSRRERVVGAKVAEFIRRVHGLMLPQHTILLSRGLGLVEGVCGELVPDENILQLVRTRLARITGPRWFVREQVAELRRLWHELRDLPNRLDSIASRPHPERLRPLLLAGVLLIAGILMEPGTLRTVATCAAGIALFLAALRRDEGTSAKE